MTGWEALGWALAFLVFVIGFSVLLVLADLLADVAQDVRADRRARKEARRATQ